MTTRTYLPEIGYPVYDLRRRKFGICINTDENEFVNKALVHIEGDRYPRWITADDVTYEYPKYYMNDALRLLEKPSNVFYVKHVHLHVPRNIWQYTIAQQGIDGFDRFTIEGETQLELIERYVPVI